MQSSDLAIPVLPIRSEPDAEAIFNRLGFEGGPHQFDSGYPARASRAWTFSKTSRGDFENSQWLTLTET